MIIRAVSEIVGNEDTELELLLSMRFSRPALFQTRPWRATAPTADSFEAYRGNRAR
jgi:hypothetical protein